jgi:eukaryotic-like serine/threonine-protein kinase
VSRFDSTPPADAWARLEQLFEQALQLTGVDRARFVDTACAGSPQLRRELEKLLEAHEALESEAAGSDRFLEQLDGAGAAALLQPGGGLDDTPGSVGRYLIAKRLGHGGMGTVYLARDPLLDRFVALKLLPQYAGRDSIESRRFVTEARAASALDHPHIGTVYEIGESDDGRLFIAMAYYDGQTLRDRLGAGPLDAESAAGIAAQVADGLAAAHAGDIIHRDIKPENLVFGPEQRVKIVDFGVAKVAEGDLTVAGVTPGTVAYMSPEQTRGGAVDQRTDYWSLGVVLYEMLTGCRPFDGGANDGVIYRIRHDPHAPVRELAPDVPPALAAVVDRCLEKDPSRRWTSATELGAALRRSCSAEPAGVRESLKVFGFLAAGYLAFAWLLFLGFGQVASRHLLPAWAQTWVAVLLLAGLPIILATAAGRRVHRRPWRAAWRPRWFAYSRPLTWPRALAGGALAFLVLGLAAGSVAFRGIPRVTDVRGSAGDAFGERSWVVLADFEAAGDHGDIAMAAREALAVDFQQSGFVNVLSRSQVAAILRRMGVPDTTRLDLELALEVAERAGAGAVLTATVSQLGPQYVLTGHALRTDTGEELFAVRTAAGSSRLLGAVERLSREMRSRLGEQRDAIRRSRPLPDVTTGSLTALMLYAEAERALGADPARAAVLAAEASRVDPEFAMAHRLAGISASNQLMFGESRRHLARAYELRDRLTERERWHVEAAYHIGVDLDPGPAAVANERILTRYPDDFRAAANLGTLRSSWFEDHEAAYSAYRRATDLDPNSLLAISNAVYTAFIAGRAPEADSLAQVAAERGFAGFAFRWRVARAFTEGDHARVAAACDSLLNGAAGVPSFPDDREYCGSMDVAAGRVERGLSRLESVQAQYEEAGRYRNSAHVGQAMAVAHMLRGESEQAAARIESALERVPAEWFEEPDRFINRTNLRLQAALLGRHDLVDRIASAYPPYPDPGHWFARVGEALVAAALAVADDDGEAALGLLRAELRPGTRPIGWRIWDELLRGMAFELTGQMDSAATHFRRASAPGHHPMPPLTKDRIYLPLALRRLAEVEEVRGDTVRATEAYGRLLDLWHGADAAVQGEVTAVRSAIARLGGGSGEPSPVRAQRPLR